MWQFFADSMPTIREQFIQIVATQVCIAYVWVRVARYYSKCRPHFFQFINPIILLTIVNMWIVKYISHWFLWYLSRILRTGKWSITLSYTRIIHTSEQPRVADRRDADDRLRAGSSAPLYTIINEIGDTRSFLQNDRLWQYYTAILYAIVLKTKANKK